MSLAQRHSDIAVHLPGSPVEARFKVRVNRFVALVEHAGREILVHVPNSGRLAELLLPGEPVWILPRAGKHRKTDFDLAFVRIPGEAGFACVDSRIPNLLLIQASGADNPLYPGFTLVRREPALGVSRLDFLYARGQESLYVEAKCVTLVTEGRRARFPDAPTERGRRHLEELTRLVRGGGHGGVLFLVQRQDAASFSPNDTMDPPFGEALRRGAEAGVRVNAWSCRVEPGLVALGQEIPVHL